VVVQLLATTDGPEFFILLYLTGQLRLGQENSRSGRMVPQALVVASCACLEVLNILLGVPRKVRFELFSCKPQILRGYYISVLSRSNAAAKIARSYDAAESRKRS
jgi:hypothetical protein